MTQPTLAVSTAGHPASKTTVQAGGLLRRKQAADAGITEISTCAIWEMFLIKRPFFRCHSIRGRFQRYGKTNKKEEFCEEACCA